jgi:hypothetical protein
MDKMQALQPRKADGSLPDVELMHLVDGSDLIDRGEDVGLPFTGSAPDLGAFELGATTMTEQPDAGMAEPAAEPDAATPPSTGGMQAPPPAGGAMKPAAAGTAAPPGATSPATGGVQPAGTAGSVAMMSSAGSSAPSTSAGDAAHGSRSEGCGCRVQHSQPAPLLPMLLAVPWLALRRRGRRGRG